MKMKAFVEVETGEIIAYARTAAELEAASDSLFGAHRYSKDDLILVDVDDFEGGWFDDGRSNGYN